MTLPVEPAATTVMTHRPDPHHPVSSVVSPKPASYNVKEHKRREYWNAPTMSLWERAYLPEILRGLSITTGIFLRNMTRWLTGRKGALTTYYP